MSIIILAEYGQTWVVAKSAIRQSACKDNNIFCLFLLKVLLPLNAESAWPMHDLPPSNTEIGDFGYYVAVL